MKNLFKGKVATVLIIVATVILAGIAIFTAVRLYNLRQEAVAPNVPSSIPQAATVAPTSNCNLSFTVESSTATPTPTGTSTPTPTGTSTATPTITPTGSPNSCGGTCGSNINCNGGLFCYIASGQSSGYCRNPSCPSVTSCNCTGTTTPTPTSTSTASLPSSGTAWPTLLGTGVGILVIFGSILLAL